MRRYPDAVAAGGDELRSLGRDFTGASVSGGDVRADLRVVGQWLTTMDDAGDPFKTVRESDIDSAFDHIKRWQKDECGSA